MIDVALIGSRCSSRFLTAEYTLIAAFSSRCIFGSFIERLTSPFGLGTSFLHAIRTGAGCSLFIISSVFASIAACCRPHLLFHLKFVRAASRGRRKDNRRYAKSGPEQRRSCNNGSLREVGDCLVNFFDRVVANRASPMTILIVSAHGVVADVAIEVQRLRIAQIGVG